MPMKPDMAEWHRRSQALRQYHTATQTTPEQVRDVLEMAISRRRACVHHLRRAAKAEARKQYRKAAQERRYAREVDAVATGIEIALLLLFLKPSPPE